MYLNDVVIVDRSKTDVTAFIVIIVSGVAFCFALDIDAFTRIWCYEQKSDEKNAFLCTPCAH